MQDYICAVTRSPRLVPGLSQNSQQLTELSGTRIRNGLRIRDTGENCPTPLRGKLMFARGAAGAKNGFPTADLR